MIDAVEIVISSGSMNQFSAFISYLKKVCFLNKKKHEVDDAFLDEITNTIASWEEEYGTKPGIDVEEFLITVYSQNKKYNYHGKGVFPKNYTRLKEILGELNDK